jgi:hypothetical protein
MPGIVESEFNVSVNLHPLLVWHGREKWETGGGIFSGVQRDFRIGSFSSLSLVSLPFVFSILLLQFSGIQQHNPGNISRRRGAVNPIAEAISNKFGQESRVVNMSVGQQNGINAGGWYRKGFPVAHSQFSFLIETAINQEPGIVNFNQES